MKSIHVYHDSSQSPLKPYYIPDTPGQIVFKDYTDLVGHISRIRVGDILVFNLETLAFQATRVQKVVSNSKGSLKVIESNRVTSGSVDFVRVHWKYLGWIRKIEDERILDAISADQQESS